MNSNSVPRSSRLRRFRILAVLLAMTPFLLLEVTVRLCGWGLPQESYDPYLGFESVEPLFVLNQDQQRYQVSESRLDFFRPEQFSAQKVPGTYRIFCLGGSTVQGRPYSLETAFSSWLELSLQAAAPERQWEVINCGGISYASYRLVPILQEVLDYEPDLLILYTGHNEFLEDRTYADAKEPGWTRRQLRKIRTNWQTINFLRQLCYQSPVSPRDNPQRVVMPTEVHGLLDQARLQDYHYDPQWHQVVIEHYQFNLQRIIQTAKRSQVPLILVNPVSNLKDCPPFKIEPGINISGADQQQFQQLWDEAHQSPLLETRIKKLQAALGLDPSHAGAHYQLGKFYEAAGQFEQAKASLLMAKDQDVCPLRMLESMHTRLLDIARQTRTPLVDARQLLEDLSDDGITGDKVLLDHVHPTIEAHQSIAEALLEKMIQLKILSSRNGWKTVQIQHYRNHLSQLPKAYYEHGKQRLAGLRLWTQGRAGELNVPPAEPASPSPAP